MPLNEALSTWKAAHDRLQALERLLRAMEAGQGTTGGPRPIELRNEVTRQREVSDRLLQHAMTLLSDRYSAGSRKP